MLAAEATLPRSSALSLTERNWLLALGIVVGSALLFAAIMALEKANGLLNRDARFVYNAVETSTRYFAVAHIVVGTLFLATSRGMARPRKRIWFVALIGAGVLACWAFQQAGGRGAYIPAALFYGYFFIHEFRDETFFYAANGDAANGDAAAAGRTPRRDLLLLPALAMAMVVGVFLAGAAWGIGGARRVGNEMLGAWPQGARLALGAAIVLGAGAFVHWHVRGLRARHGSLRSFLRAHRPMVLVFAGTFGVLVFGVLLTGRLYPIVAIHVAAWYVFATRQLARAPKPATAPRPFTWRWMRTTQVGFQTLHIGLYVLLIGLGLVWAYAYGNDPSYRGLWVTISRDAFPYWTIMHVTLSFTPR